MTTTDRVHLVHDPEGGYVEIRGGARWVRTDGDGFANSDLECCACEKTVDGGEAAFYCLDGGEVAHARCTRVVSALTVYMNS